MINCFNEFFLEEVVGGKLRGKMDRCVYCASYLGQSAIIINAVGPDNEDVCHVQVWFGYSYCGILHHYTWRILHSMWMKKLWRILRMLPLDLIWDVGSKIVATCFTYFLNSNLMNGRRQGGNRISCGSGHRKYGCVSYSEPSWWLKKWRRCTFCLLKSISSNNYTIIIIQATGTCIFLKVFFPLFRIKY